MKIILSPAKKMVSDTDSLAPVNVPKHMDQTAEILSFMKSQSKEELKAVWKCNDKIAEQNFHRLETMDPVSYTHLVSQKTIDFPEYFCNNT